MTLVSNCYGLQYRIDQNPPVITCIFLGLQVFERVVLLQGNSVILSGTPLKFLKTGLLALMDRVAKD